jgi:hypothetical protein
MVNWNYTIKEKGKNLVLINQNTKNEDYKVKSINRENKYLEVSSIVSLVKCIKLPYCRIDNINEELLKEHFPEDYI